ncbi:hypothetical protein ACOMHN_051412 [Nucella lapillus]
MMDDEVITNVTGGNSSSVWNITVEQFLLERLGPRSKDTWSAVVLTVVYSIIFLSGSVGNICTCIVIVRNHCMQTTTNYYLFSLAVSDLMLLFFGSIVSGTELVGYTPEITTAHGLSHYRAAGMPRNDSIPELTTIEPFWGSILNDVGGDDIIFTL